MLAEPIKCHCWLLFGKEGVAVVLDKRSWHAPIVLCILSTVQLTSEGRKNKRKSYLARVLVFI